MLALLLSLAALATPGPVDLGEDGVIDLELLREVEVVGADGTSIPNARVDFVSDGIVVQRGRTLADGTTRYLPITSEDSTPVDHLVVRYRGAEVRVDWDGEQDLEVTVPLTPPRAWVVPLDLLFLVDTTGSMSDEIDRVKDTITDLTTRIHRLPRDVTLRYGALLYRDLGDAYVTRDAPMTVHTHSFERLIQTADAGGGGDEPEAMDQALHEAVHDTRWRQGAARMIVLLADAPPHDGRPGPTYGESALDAVEEGIRIHTVACSGTSVRASEVMEQLACMTGGRHHRLDAGEDLAAVFFEEASAEVEVWME